LLLLAIFFIFVCNFLPILMMASSEDWSHWQYSITDTVERLL
jgi:hypothetical protein